MVKTTHLIKEYKVRANTIECYCDWLGDATDFSAHQNSSPPTDKVSENPYSMDKFGGFSLMTLKKLLADPSYFDYIRDVKPSEITGRKNKNYVR